MFGIPKLGMNSSKKLQNYSLKKFTFLDTIKTVKNDKPLAKLSYQNIN
jgi:hypothetical protein